MMRKNAKYGKTLKSMSFFLLNTKKNPSGDCSLKGFICKSGGYLKVAATYSPTGVQYHRREQA